MRQDVIPIVDAGARAAELRDLRETLHNFEAAQIGTSLAVQSSRAAIIIGHELRQPLFTIAMASENLRLMLELADIPKTKMQLAIGRIAEQVQRAQEIIARSLSYMQGGELDAGPDDLVQALHTSLRFLDGLFETSGIAVEQRNADLFAPVPLGHIEIEQIFVNVLRNAVDSITARRRQGWNGEGRIVIECEIDDAGLRCTISDNGAGLPGGVAEEAFQPFFTTKSSEGTGLGLYICRQALSAAGGEIRLQPGESEGAEIEIRLPLYRSTAAAG